MDQQTPTKEIRSGLNNLSVAENLRTPPRAEHASPSVTERSLSMATIIEEGSSSPAVSKPELDDPYHLFKLAMQVQERNDKKRKHEAEEEIKKRRRIEEEKDEEIRCLKNELALKREELKLKDLELLEARIKIKAQEERIQDAEKLARDMPRIEELCYQIDAAIKEDRVKRKAKAAHTPLAQSRAQSRL